MEGLKRGPPLLRALLVAGALAGLLAIAVISGLQGLNPPNTAHAADDQGLSIQQMRPDGPGLGGWSLAITYDDSLVSVFVDSAILDQNDGISVEVVDALVVVDETTGTGATFDEATVPADTSGIGWQFYVIVTSIGAILVVATVTGLNAIRRRARRGELTEVDANDTVSMSTTHDDRDLMQRATEQGRVARNPT